MGEFVTSLVEKAAEVLGITTRAADLKAQALKTPSTNNVTGSTDNPVYSAGHSRGTMTDVGAYRTLGAQGFTNPNLIVIENNPAAKQERIEQSAGQITKPANVQIYAPKNDPVATFVGGYKDGDMGASLKEVPTMIETGYSIHSSPNAGAVGNDSANVNKPFSYEGVNIDQLNQTRQPQTDAVLEKVLSQTAQKPAGLVADPTTQLQQQITNDNAARMNALRPSGPALPLIAPRVNADSRTNAMRDLLN